MATAFKDIGKTAKDLLTKNFPDPKKVGSHLAFGVSSKLKATEYVTVTTEVNKHPNGDDVSATVESVFDITEHKTKVTLKLDVEQKYDITVERREIIEGVTVQLGGSFTEDSTTGKFDVGYQNENVNGGVEISYAHGAKAPKIAPRLAGTYDNFQAGANAIVDLNQDKDKIQTYGVAGSFNDKKNIATVYYNADPKGNLSGASFYHKYSGDIELGGDLSFKNHDFSKPTILVGGSYKSRETSLFKFRLLTTGTDNVRVGFASEEKFHHFKLQTAYDLNLHQFSGQVTKGDHKLNGATGHQFSVKLVLD
jgi:hypothetical protein